MIIKKVEIVEGGQAIRTFSTKATGFCGVKTEYHPWEYLTVVGVALIDEGVLVLHQNQKRINSSFDEPTGDRGTYKSYGDKKIGSNVKLVGAGSPLMTVERIEQFPNGMYFQCWWYDARAIMRRAWFHEDEISTH